MRLDHNFTVPVSVDEAWKVLLDLPRVAPCMPGATLTGVEDDTFTGTVKVKLGPINLTYQGKGRFVERDEAAHRVVIEANGRDARAAGTAAATVTATLVPEGGGSTRVDVATDLTVTGRPAQFGRGMLADVSGKLINQFAECLAETIAAPPTTSPPPTSVEHTTPASPDAASPAPTPSGTTPSGTTPSGTTPSGTATSGTGGTVAAPREAEAVDLLRLAGSTNAAKRYAAYVGGAVVIVGVLVWLFSRLLRR